VSDDWQALLGQASALRRAGRVEDAIAAYERLLALYPALPDSWYNLGFLQRQARRFEEALESYGQSLGRGVADPQEVHVNRAVILADHLARPADAEVELQRALAIDPAYVPALLNLGNLAEDLGRREDAQSAYRSAFEAEPANPLALARLAHVSSPVPLLIADLREALRREGLPPAGRADLGYALARLLDLAGEYDGAFDAAAAANTASRASFGPGFRGYDRPAHEALVDRLIATFDAPADGAREADGRQLIFICGMFRSGSTLCEQILASHSKVAAGGELDLLPAIVERELQPYPEALATLTPTQTAELRRSYLRGLDQRGLDAPVVTDKRPDNILHVGLIKTLFPQAKIIHTRRDALDNVLSLHFLQLSPEMPYALDVEDSAHWLAEQERLAAHWRALYPDDIFELDYDALVAEPRQCVEALLAFCGLDWEDSVLDFHASANPVKTASVWQVRQPLHGRSSGRWRNYSEQLEALASRLNRRD
jgi:tetratricopeptide (TPR) repeat protein